MKNLILRITNRRITKLIAFVILALSIATTDVYAFTNRPSKPPVGARIDPLHPMSRGLVAWWLFNDVSGSSLNDITGKASGTFKNFDGSDDWVGSPKGGGLDFDGTNDYVDMGSQPDLRFNSGNFTIAGWVKPDVITSSHNVVGNYNDGTDRGYVFAVYLSKSQYYCQGWKASNTTLSTGIWYHIAITIDSSGNYIFYLNSVSDGSGASAVPSGTEDTFKIGAYGVNGNAGRFNGIIDDVRIYNRVLSVEEVAELYRNPYIGLRQRPVKWYGVDDPPASFTPTVTWW